MANTLGDLRVSEKTIMNDTKIKIKRPLRPISIYNDGMRPEYEKDIVAALDSKNEVVYAESIDAYDSQLSNTPQKLESILLRRYETGDNMDKFKEIETIKKELLMEMGNQKLAKTILLGLINGDGNIYSRMASSSQYAVDPIDEVDGLRTVYDEIVNVLKETNDKKAAKELANTFLSSLV